MSWLARRRELAERDGSERRGQAIGAAGSRMLRTDLLLETEKKSALCGKTAA
jgi:hypothetical protein